MTTPPLHKLANVRFGSFAEVQYATILYTPTAGKPPSPDGRNLFYTSICSYISSASFRAAVNECEKFSPRSIIPPRRDY